MERTLLLGDEGNRGSGSSETMGGGRGSEGSSVLSITLDGRVTGLPEPDVDDESWCLASSSALSRASARIALVASAASASWFCARNFHQSPPSLDERKRERTSTSPAIRSSSNTANLHLAISNSFSALSASISAVLIRAFHAPKSGPVAPEGPENDFCFSIPILGLFRASLIFPDDCRPP